MSLALRAINRLRRQYRFILNHMRDLNHLLFNPPCKILLTHRPSCSVEPLEARLLLSGTHYVVDSLADTIADDGALTLREAIIAANTNEILFEDIPVGSATEADIITFDRAALGVNDAIISGEALTITLNDGQLEITDDLEIYGLGAEILAIDANSQSRVMEISDCEVSLSALTLTGGWRTADGSNDDGGGILNEEATLTLTDSVVSGNETEVGHGGGIYNDDGTLILVSSTVSGNSARDGGGISSDHGTLMLVHSTVSENSSYGRSGGIEIRFGLLTLMESMVSDNTAGGDGGGIHNHEGTLVVTNSTISGNMADDGGGIENGGGTLTLTNSTISGNTAFDGDGGGIESDSGALTVINSIVSGNTALAEGGGIYGFNAAILLTNSTVAGNTAGQDGGGIYVEYSNWISDKSMTLNNSIVSLNNALNTDSDDFEMDTSDICGEYLSHNSLISTDPGFVRDPSDGVDGLWGTDDDDHGDLKLSGTSPAIDLGDSVLAVDGDGVALTLDHDGNPRIVNGSVDIGAYEYQGSPSSLREVSPVVTTLDDVVDSTDGLVSLREALVYGSLLDEEVSFDESLAGGTITLAGEQLYLYQSVTVDATSIGGMIINADGQSRVVYIAKGDIYLTALILTGGAATSRGGCIYNSEDCSVTLTNSTASGNAARTGGGGIYNKYGSVTLVNSEISASESHDSGAIENLLGTVTLINSKISGNTAQFAGGIMNFSGTVILISSTISENMSGGVGGIGNFGGSIILTNSTVTGNSGGGICNDYGTVVLTNSTVSGNSGGGICNEDGTVVLTNSTISGNSVRPNRLSGGICNSDGTVTLNNSIVALNVNEAGSDSNIYGSYISNSSLVGIDPAFVRNPSAGDDGEWGTDDDDYGDLRLRPDSVAIDAGDRALAVDADGEVLFTDIRGADRITGESVDIGAYEYQDMSGDANGDEIVNLDDFIILKQNYGLASGATKAEGDFNTDTGVNLDDFIILKQNYGSSLAITPSAAASVAVELAAPATPATPATVAERATTSAPVASAPSDTADILAATAVKPTLDPIGQLGWVSPLEALLADNFEILDITDFSGATAELVRPPTGVGANL